MNLLKWILFPGAMVVLRIGGDDGGDGGAGARSAEEERRKEKLRERIDRLYGVRTTKKVPAPHDPENAPGMFVRKGNLTGEEIEVEDPEAIEAKRLMEEENTKLANATRSYYTDQLGDEYGDAERNTRFKLARQGLLGGSEDVFQQGDVKSDRDLGATRVDEAVRRAIAGLTGQREQERLNAINLVNSGSGDSAVSAASAGLKNAFASAESAQKANLFTDLFSNSADAVAGSNTADQQAALAARYRDRLSTFFPARGTTSGRVTPSA